MKNKSSKYKVKSPIGSPHELKSGHTHGEQFVQTCDIQLRYMS